MLSEEDKAMARMHVSVKGFVPIWKAAVMPKDGETVQLLYADIDDKLQFTIATYDKRYGGRFFRQDDGKLLYSYVAYRPLVSRTCREMEAKR